jgi:hypothetical protein
VVAHYDLDELRRLDAGGWFGRRFRGEQVPTLQERGPLHDSTSTSTW